MSVVQIFIPHVLKSDTAFSCESTVHTQNIVMATEIERKFFEICDITKALVDDRKTLVGRLENIEKKYNILQDLWQRSREELKEAQFKIDQLEIALLDGPPNVITIVDPSQSPSGVPCPSVLKEEDTDSSSISTMNSDMKNT